MSASNPSPNIRSWALDIDERTVVQASRTARLPILAGPLALMPDAHVGIGATVGSVIATDGALVPSAVGVDVGCGMIAARTDLTADALPDDLAPLLDGIAATIPAGVGRGHAEVGRRGDRWFAEHPMPGHLNENQRRRAAVQFATLGSGNHFAELSVDERDSVWFVLHSGSRGIGNELAQGHINAAKRDFARVVEGHKLEDPDLAWVVAGTPAFDAYVADLQWLQAYAAGSRAAMMHAALEQLFAYVGHGRELDRVNAHHNYAQLEAHVIDGAPRDVWLTRKGAIRARVGDRGIIPGSMGTATYIVEGLGNEASWCSCAHGAGRRMSRTQAKRELTADSLTQRMEGKTWLAKDAARLVDEHPDAYKDIETVLAQQADLVRVTHRLTQILNYKG